MSSHLKPVVPQRLAAHLQPWKPHARRLAGAGRGLRSVAVTLTEFYGIFISHKAVRLACKDRQGTLNGSNSVDREKLNDSQRERLTDSAESWLAGKPVTLKGKTYQRADASDYAESRRMWQQPQTDALARMREVGEVETFSKGNESEVSADDAAELDNEIADCALQIGREEEPGPHVGGTARPFEYDEDAG